MLLVGYLVLFTLIVFGTFHGFGIFLKPLAESLKIGRAQVSAAISIGWICNGISSIIGGALSDRHGPRVVMACATFLIGLGYVVMSTCSSILELYIYFGVMVGMGMGPAFVITSATAAKWFPDKRGLMLGIILAGPGLGRIIIAPLSHYLIKSYEFHTAYLVLGILVLSLALPIALNIKPAPKQSAEFGILGEAVGQRLITGRGIRVALGQRAFWLLLFIWLQVPFAIQLWQVHFFPHVSDRGFPETAASLLFVFSGIGLIVGRITWGAIADRSGNIKTLAYVFLLICGAQLSAIGVYSLWHVYLVAAFFGFSMGGNDPVYVKIVVETFGPHFAGTIIGILTFAFALSSSLGPLIAGFIMDQTKSYNWGFIIASLALLLAMLTLYSLKLSIQRKPYVESKSNVPAEI